MKRYQILLGLILVFLFFPLSAICQPGPGPTFNPVPVDGFISLLVIGGVALGLKKTTDNKNIDD